jgi:hypothetical protein
LTIPFLQSATKRQNYIYHDPDICHEAGVFLMRRIFAATRRFATAPV